jgi:hypothetical protein
MEKCEHQKVSKQSGKRTYASKYLGNCHPNYVGFNNGNNNLIWYRDVGHRLLAIVLGA